MTEKRIAILGSSTIGDIREVLEVFLLNFGIKPKFHIGQYNRFYEEIMFDNGELKDFAPDIIMLHTSVLSLSDDLVWDKLRSVWSKIKEDFSCAVIQNNFELPPAGFKLSSGDVNKLNILIDEYAEQNTGFHINNIQHLSANYGLDKWFSRQDFHLYKYAFSVRAIPAFCYNAAVIIKSIYGKNKKCLVLDLDNTIWGGVIGDIGSSGIELGMETAPGEAYVAFQKYAKSLHNRGVILAVCSKNDESIAKTGFSNPNMVLKLEDIAMFMANWNDKASNIQIIAERLNILPDSLVFIDDNPAERELVRLTLPSVTVPEVNSVVEFIDIIEWAGYFYATDISEDDVKRNEYYANEVKRSEVKSTFLDYGDYLKSLEMSSIIQPFVPEHFERISQLINKTNQFNLTTVRHSISEVEKFAADSKYITLEANLDDKFGSNGIVSALICEIKENELHIRSWVMSCRVFKRELELAMFDRLVELCQENSIKRIIGYYYKTEKNGFVSDLLDELGFEKMSDDFWTLSVTSNYAQKNQHIKALF